MLILKRDSGDCRLLDNNETMAKLRAASSREEVVALL